ncbi:MAG: FliI/YscN family ATPase [Gammaproteobacteria bacterium]|nr:FliI/YscN family ATPase [Gammaproteobacteria bacterium]
MSCEQLRDSLVRYSEGLYQQNLSTQGRLTSSVGLALQAEGCNAPVGSRCRISTETGELIEAQVIGFKHGRTLLMPAGPVRGLCPKARVSLVANGLRFSAGNGLLGRVIDANGIPIDGKGPLVGCYQTELSSEPVNPLSRAPVNEAFDVGVRSINGLLTLGRGQRVGLFAGSGVGKSALLGMMSKYSEADVTVLALVGERGREVNDFIRETLGVEGMKRCVVVAVPADQAPLLRLQGAMLATAIAEEFRAANKQVLLMVDSLTRFAQAQREVGLAIGEPPTSKGYPPSVFSLLPQLVERAGGISGGGSITAIYTVLAEGDDQNDPIVDAARAVLDGHIVLSRTLSDAAHYPAIDIGASVSRTKNAVTPENQQQMVSQAMRYSAIYQQNADMIKVGMYQQGSDDQLDTAVQIWPNLQRYLQQELGEKVSLDQAREQLSIALQLNAESGSES